jgi:hypothetical protein
MGTYTIYPNIYAMFVGDPGVIRKSTTIGMAEKLLLEIDEVKIASTAMSVSKLMNVLSQTDDGSISIMPSELGTFMNISKDEMYDALTDLYDGKVKYEYSTRQWGDELTENPCVSMLAATTPTWIANQMPSAAIGGGFASRTVFVFENTVRQREMYYDLDQRHFDGLESMLRNDLMHIADRCVGEFRHESAEVKEEMRRWYKKTADLPIPDGRLSGYFQRKPTHVHKVAMLLSLSERDDLVITSTHFRAALALLESLEDKMSRVFSSIGKNPYASELEAVLDYIASNRGWIPKPRIAARFLHDVDIAGCTEILKALVLVGEIETDRFQLGRSLVDHYRIITRDGTGLQSPNSDPDLHSNS